MAKSNYWQRRIETTTEIRAEMRELGEVGGKSAEHGQHVIERESKEGMSRY